MEDKNYFKEKKGEEMGKTSIIIFSTYIGVVLFFNSKIGVVINSTPLGASDIIVVSAIISIIYIWIQLSWSLNPDVEERTSDDMVSFLPIIVIVVFVTITIVTGGKNVFFPIFVLENFIIFVLTFFVDIALISKVGKKMLELKDKMQIR